VQAFIGFGGNRLGNWGHYYVVMSKIIYVY
jgi:hypothetical protein